MVSWLRLFAITGIAQTVLQAIALVAGVVVIRSLSAHEYALYTLTMAAISTASVLADSGLVMGASGLASRVWTDRSRLGEVLATAISLRRQLAVATFVVAMPFLAWVLMRHDADIASAALLCALAMLTVTALLNAAVLELPIKLHQDVARLQGLQLAAGSARVLLLAAVCSQLPFASSAVACACVIQAGLVFGLGKLARRRIEPAGAGDPEHRRVILEAVKRGFPSTLFYCLSGQLTIWVLSLRGTTVDLAQLGALTRVSSVFAVLGAAVSLLIVPRFTRIPREDGARLRRRFVQIQVVLVTLCVAVAALSVPLAPLGLALIGPTYAGLEHELSLACFGAALVVMSEATHGLIAFRGVILAPLASTLYAAATQVLLLILLDVATLSGALWFSIAYALAQYVLWLIWAVIVLFRADQATRPARRAATMGPPARLP